MYIAVCAGLAGRVNQAFLQCARWEVDRGKKLSCLLQLGDLPLLHDFSFRKASVIDANTGPAPADPDASLPPGTAAPEKGAEVGIVSVPDLVHGRRKPAYPVVFLAGEQDDPGLIAYFERKRRRLRPRPGDGPALRLALNFGEPASLHYLPSGGSLVLQDSGEEIRIAGVSAYGAEGAGECGARGGQQPNRGRQSNPGRHLKQPLGNDAIGTVDLLISHDTPESLIERTGGPDRGHPGRHFLAALDRLHPPMAFHGHAVSGARIYKYGGAAVCALPPWPKSAEAGVMAVYDTRTRSVEWVGS